MPTLEQRASASSIEWVVKMTQDLQERVEIFAMTSHINRLALGSIPVLSLEKGKEARGKEARGKEARGKEPRGKEPRGKEARGLEARGLESIGTHRNSFTQSINRVVEHSALRLADE
jgi:hypothetical protein